MRLRAFDFLEPDPELHQPHALTVIQPWIDVSDTGSVVLSYLEASFGAQPVARLARPGNFFDLTRYRPTLRRENGDSQLEVPNAIITAGRQPGGRDFLFLRLLEPHSLAEEYVSSVLALFHKVGVKRYCLIGSMYDMVPYTRPLLITGSASTLGLQNILEMEHVVSSDYQGPTTILSLIAQKALEMGIETCSLIVHIPSYLVIEDDYRGVRRLMEVMSSLYNVAMSQADLEKAKQQESQVRLIADRMLQQEPQLRLILEQLESNYDARINQGSEGKKLSPEIEKFLQDLDKRFRQG